LPAARYWSWSSRLAAAECRAVIAAAWPTESPLWLTQAALWSTVEAAAG
jgi:hypothetical protein